MRSFPGTMLLNHCSYCCINTALDEPIFDINDKDALKVSVWSLFLFPKFCLKTSNIVVNNLKMNSLQIFYALLTTSAQSK